MGNPLPEQCCAFLIGHALLIRYDYWDTCKAYNFLCEFLQVGHFTLDNASNNRTMMQALELELARRNIPFNAADRQVMCFGHVVNLSSGRVIEYIRTNNAEDDDDGMSNPIEHARSVVSTIRASGMRRDAFKSAIEQGNENGWFTQGQPPEVVTVQKLELLRDVQTRWDSVYLMLQRLRVLRPVSLHVLLN